MPPRLLAPVAALLLLAGIARADDRPCPALAPALPLPGLSAAVAQGEPLTIVALGSSSTAGAGASAPEMSYPARLAASLRRALPGMALTVVNAGIGGEEAPDMLARLDRDVLAQHPRLVVWQAGANGAMRGRDPEAFRRALLTGIARLRQAGAEVVLMDNQRAPRVNAAPGHERFDRVMAEVAREARVALFSRGRLMDAWNAAGLPGALLLTGDGVHHNDRGYACIADALAQAILGGLRGNAIAARDTGGARELAAIP